MQIAVAGGTGVVGRHVVEDATRRGHTVLSLSRSSGVDLRTGNGLAARLSGIDTVIDVSNHIAQKRAKSEAFFEAVTRTLLTAEATAGVGHHLALSIVGIDDVLSGYYAGKLRQEHLVATGDVPWTILRATQFFEFSEQLVGMARIGPVSLVPRMTSQPVAAVEVAAHLLDLAEAGPAGRVPDLAGPDVHEMVDLARRVAPPGRRVLGLPLPGRAGRAMRSGALCPTGPGLRGQLTFDQWVASR